MKFAQHTAHNPKFEEMELFGHPRVGAKLFPANQNVKYECFHCAFQIFHIFASCLLFTRLIKIQHNKENGNNAGSYVSIPEVV